MEKVKSILIWNLLFQITDSTYILIKTLIFLLFFVKIQGINLVRGLTGEMRKSNIITDRQTDRGNLIISLPCFSALKKLNKDEPCKLRIA